MDKKNLFIEYQALSRNVIEDLAQGLAKIENAYVNRIAGEEFFTYFHDITSPDLLSYSVETISLLGVPNALVLVSFDEHPFPDPSDRCIGGWTRLIRQPDSGLILPCIYLMPNHADDTIEHERIHICQYLLDSAYPMTSEQREFYLFFPENMIDCFLYLRENLGNSIASDFIINAVSYVFWIEMEANYVTRKPEDLWSWMEKVYKSATPIMKFKSLYQDHGWDNADHLVKFREFCEILESEVEWIKEIVSRMAPISLFDNIMELQDELETELMFGPLDEDEIEEMLGSLDEAEIEEMLRPFDEDEIEDQKN